MPDIREIPRQNATHSIFFNFGVAKIPTSNYYRIMSKTHETTRFREVAIELGECRSCQGCIDMNPDIFKWDEVLDMPYVCRSKVTEAEVQDIINCCPEDCIVLLDC